MTAKQDLLKRIKDFKDRREDEIRKIPMGYLRRRYLEKLGSDEKMRKVFSGFGYVMKKYFDNPVLRPIFHHLNSGLGPRNFKRQFQRGNQPKNFFDDVVDYCMFATSYGAWPLDIEEVTEEKVVAYFDTCPVQCENRLKLCLAATSMEPELSKKKYFGARVTYTERMPEGAKRCKVVFEKKPNTKKD